MRIAINARFLLKDKMEGIGRYSYEITKRLVEQHPDDEFFLFFDRPFSEEFIFAKNVTPIVLFPPARHPFLWYLFFEFAVAKALKKYKIDVFFSPDGYLSLRSKVHTLLTVHDIAFVHFPDLISGLVSKYYRYFTPRFLAKAKKIVSVSAFVKQDIINYYKIPSEKIAITYNACQNIYQTISIENQQLIKEKYSKGKNYIFFVGAVHPRKNVHRLIEAFDVFKSKTNSDFKLLIAGRFAWQTGEVKNAFDKAKHKEDICFLGFVAENELSLLMASAFALVWVSLFEGFGIPLLEAMQCDVPIITSNSTAMPEVVGEAGITVEPTDIQAIANAMQVIFEDEALKQKLIEKGRIQREKFNWNISSAVVYDLLKEIASK
jgi:glycosyltransferase involved in cell wall biosynthesis